MNKIIQGDSVKVMKTFPPESIDLIVTDPPYGYSFMGKNWDKAVPSVEVWKECLRVLKAGAFMFVMSAPRQDVLSQMIVRLGQAGFETGFTSIYWAYATGFPKAMNISKAIDKKLGYKGKIISKNKLFGRHDSGIYELNKQGLPPRNEWNIIEVESKKAKVLDGSYAGFQPKPAVEVILVCMKPLSEKTYVEQALKNEKGVTWLDDCRIPSDHPIKTHGKRDGTGISLEWSKYKSPEGYEGNVHEGRFPANLLVSDDVLNDGKITVSKGGIRHNKTPNLGRNKIYGDSGVAEGLGIEDKGSFSRYFDLDAWWLKTVENFPENVKRTFPFLICPKASKGERNKGLEGAVPQSNMRVNAPRISEEAKFKTKHKNFHPTVKPIKLMSYLVTLGSREGDVVLDPFVGSGTTCIAAEMLNRKWLGIDINVNYVEMAKKRLSKIPCKLDKFVMAE